MCGRDLRLARTGGVSCPPRESTWWLPGFHITLDEPRHVDVTGDFAYVVVPATVTFDLGDREITQTGSLFTVALRKVDTDWRLSAWAWTKGS